MPKFGLITDIISSLPRSASGYATSVVCVREKNHQKVKDQGLSSRFPTFVPLVHSHIILDNEKPSETIHQEIGVNMREIIDVVLVKRISLLQQIEKVLGIVCLGENMVQIWFNYKRRHLGSIGKVPCIS